MSTVQLESEIAALHRAADRCALDVLATDPKDLDRLSEMLGRLAAAHAELYGADRADILDGYVCVLSSMADKAWS